MLFSTWPFFLFLAAVLSLHYALPRPFRKYLLLAASYVFYMSWNAKFAVLLAGLTVVDFAAAILLERLPATRRKCALIFSLAANLGMLGFFKYYNFLAFNTASVFGLDQHRWALDIVLPLGISFHTFQSISYVMDVYRADQRAIRNLADYALYISFFPQLIAGPIVRAHQFFADLASWRAPTNVEWRRGALLLLLGLAKKVAVADQFGLIADRYFQNVAAQTGRVFALSGVFAFDMQVYFDFAGYTDMAIGMALLLGFHFPENFRRPYLSQTVTEFWRRWHMSLSTWLRDYLWFPLSANRRGRLSTYRNLMITMLLVGLWHGASWNFVLWGGWHGALLSAEHALGFRPIPTPNRWLAPLRVTFTFALVALGWILFRARTLAEAGVILNQIVLKGGGTSLCPGWLYWLATGTLLLAWLEERFNWFERVVKGSAWTYAAVASLLLFATELLTVSDVNLPFIYFQF